MLINNKSMHQSPNWPTMFILSLMLIMNHISILEWNVRGIMSSSMCLSKLLNDKNIDIALINEHKLLPYNNSFIDSIDKKFIALTKCDTSVEQYGMLKCGKAGVSIMYHKRFSAYIEHVDIDSDRIIGIKLVGFSNKPYFIFSVYLPASNNIENFKDELGTLNDVTNFYSEKGYVIVGGDMNASLADNQNINIAKSKLLRTFIENNNLCYKHDRTNITNNGPNYTFIPYQTTIDYIHTDQITSCRVSHYETLDEGNISSTSDHLPTICKIKTSDNMYPHNRLNTPINDQWISWHKVTSEHIKKYQKQLDDSKHDILNRSINHNCDIDYKCK